MAFTAVGTMDMGTATTIHITQDTIHTNTGLEGYSTKKVFRKIADYAIILHSQNEF